MFQKIFNIFQNKEQKDALKKLQTIEKSISLIKLPGEIKNFEKEIVELRNKLHSDPSIKEIVIEIDKLSKKVENYIRVKENKDYSDIIEYLITENISSVFEIVEICDTSDREIVFKYLQARQREAKEKLFENPRKKIASAEQILRRMPNILSENKDVEDLRSIWINILRGECDKLEDLKNRINNLKLNDIEQDTSNMLKRIECLEKYGLDYISEHRLEALTKEIKGYLPSDDVKPEEILSEGLADCIITDLKNCIGRETEGRAIKQRVANIIYSRLKKEMFLR